MYVRARARVCACVRVCLSVLYTNVHLLLEVICLWYQRDVNEQLGMMIEGPHPKTA